jgi:hypothetical protein
VGLDLLSLDYYYKCIFPTEYNLNEENRKIIWSKIQSTGDLLQPLLKPSSFHPKGRNAYAHISLSIKEKFNQSYKDIPDKEFEKVIEYIDYLLKNPD